MQYTQIKIYIFQYIYIGTDISTNIGTNIGTQLFGANVAPKHASHARERKDWDPNAWEWIDLEKSPIIHDLPMHQYLLAFTICNVQFMDIPPLIVNGLINNHNELLSLTTSQVVIKKAI